MDNPCGTNMNIPKFLKILYGLVTSCKFAFLNDSKTRFGMPRIIQISLILSILCGDPPKFYKSNCPLFFHSHKPNTKKHNQKKKRDISQKPVHFLAQRQRQSPRLWTATIPSIFPKG